MKTYQEKLINYAFSQASLLEPYRCPKIGPYIIAILVSGLIFFNVFESVLVKPALITELLLEKVTLIYGTRTPVHHRESD